MFLNFTIEDDAMVVVMRIWKKKLLLLEDIVVELLHLRAF